MKLPHWSEAVEQRPSSVSHEKGNPDIYALVTGTDMTRRTSKVMLDMMVIDDSGSRIVLMALMGKNMDICISVAYGTDAHLGRFWTFTIAWS
ncbi:unnamed protein product [Dovyalis caffra]|uniref:Uncharacterized protein n=1 Tax=Dovyalis caffra TaxID=77055 RepID=A0AAV1SEU7_9ROSI|nr:unnamed protein product [Dovyalis caffra]